MASRFLNKEAMMRKGKVVWLGDTYKIEGKPVEAFKGHWQQGSGQTRPDTCFLVLCVVTSLAYSDRFYQCNECLFHMERQQDNSRFV